MKEISLSEIEGFLVGHAESKEYGTGCTAVLAPEGAAASCYTPGFAPGSMETEALRPSSLVEKIHGLLLTGGSACGLSAAAGVREYLKEKGVGLKVRGLTVPLVSGAVIFDYPFNKSDGALPDRDMGYLAASNASSSPLLSGPFGAGTSARCGKLGDPLLSSPSGIGSYGLFLPSGIKIAALAVVNSLGSLLDPEKGEIISGVRHKDGSLLNRGEILELLAQASQADGEGEKEEPATANTVLVVVGLNSPIDKRDAHRLSRMAGAGIARAIYPAHLLYDGDTVFTMSAGGGPKADLSFLGALAADVAAKAIVRSAKGGSLF
jgi:L-aminopeptidase/D-esterase-like protein